ncbi:MAG: hypothetical protein ACRD5Z_21130, partial [Bryobacteraceae bacterium]
CTELRRRVRQIQRTDAVFVYVKDIDAGNCSGDCSKELKDKAASTLRRFFSIVFALTSIYQSNHDLNVPEPCTETRPQIVYLVTLVRADPSVRLSRKCDDRSSRE